jgi:hypothetical protein
MEKLKDNIVKILEKHKVDGNEEYHKYLAQLISEVVVDEFREIVEESRIEVTQKNSLVYDVEIEMYNEALDDILANLNASFAKK